MSETSVPAALRPDRPFVVGALVLALAVTVWLFVPTMLGQLAVMNADAIDVTATEYAVSDDGETLRVSMAVHNPTRRSVELKGGLLLVHAADGTQLSDGTTSTFEEVTVVPPDETETVTAHITLEDGEAGRTRTAIASNEMRLSGRLNALVGDREIHPNIRTEGTN